MFDNKAELLRREEQELEEFIATQQAERLKAEDEKWAAEAETKRRLMMEVYNDRQKAVDHHKWLQREEARKAEEEKNALDAEIARQNSLFEAMRAEKASNRKLNQGDLLRQISEKERKQREDLRDFMYEERTKKLAELAYQRKVRDEKDQARQRLEVLKQNATFMV